jgi:hypothetical protein
VWLIYFLLGWDIGLVILVIIFFGIDQNYLLNFLIHKRLDCDSTHLSHKLKLIAQSSLLYTYFFYKYYWIWNLWRLVYDKCSKLFYISNSAKTISNAGFWLSEGFLSLLMLVHDLRSTLTVLLKGIADLMHLTSAIPALYSWKTAPSIMLP